MASRHGLQEPSRSSGSPRSASGTRSATGSRTRRSGCPAASSSCSAWPGRSPSSPEVLLLDEPTSSLDPVATESIEALHQDAGAPQLTVVIVTHNLAQARRVADRTIFLNQGRLVEHGDTQQVFENPAEEETARYVGGRFG